MNSMFAIYVLNIYGKLFAFSSILICFEAHRVLSKNWDSRFLKLLLRPIFSEPNHSPLTGTGSNLLEPAIDYRWFIRTSHPSSCSIWRIISVVCGLALIEGNSSPIGQSYQLQSNCFPQTIQLLKAQVRF